jgi:hypothetical protein
LIEGEVEKSVKLSLDDIMTAAPIEERIYRHGCVKGGKRWQHRTSPDLCERHSWCDSLLLAGQRLPLFYRCLVAIELTCRLMVLKRQKPARA